MKGSADESLAAPGRAPGFLGRILLAGVPRLCNGVIEAAWLAAVVLAPCLCNPLSESGYQPNKIAFVRMLACIIAAAWMTKSAGGERPVWSRAGEALRSGLRVPFLFALGALVLSYGLSTAFSVNPRASLWGTYETAQGLFTFGCVLVIFAALAAHLRSPGQIERLVSTITIASFPLALYGLIERAGYGSLLVLAHYRVFSLLGHPDYFASYLLLVMPLCLLRLLNLAREFRAGSGTSAWRVAGLALYASILAAQVLAFVFTETRAADLGMVVGLGFFLCSMGVLRRRRFTLLLGSGLVMTILLALGLLNLPNGPFRHWTTLPLVHRLSETFSPKEAAASRRMDYWAASVKIMTASQPLALGPQADDHWHWLRPLVGYGPETVQFVFPRMFTESDPNQSPENRVHDLMLDTWLTLGAIGVAALLACFTLIFLQVYRFLRWVSSAHDLLLFFGLAFGLALVTATALVLWRGPGLVGAGLQCGLAAGLALYPVAAFLLRINDRAEESPVSQYYTLLLALLAALLAHLVDTAFGFETAATSVLIWAYPGVIVALTWRNGSDSGDHRLPAAGALDPNPDVATGSQKDEGHALAPGKGLNLRSALVSAAITALILVSLLFTFIHIYSYDSLSTWAVLGQSLTRIDQGQRSNPWLLPVLLLTWFGCGLALTLDQARDDPRHRWRGHFLVTLAISGLLAGAYAVLKGFQVAALCPVPDTHASVASVLRQCSGYILICLVFLGICVGFVFWAGWLISRDAPLTRRKPGSILAAGLGSTVILVLLSWFTTIRFIRADVSCRWGELLGDTGDKAQSVEVFRHTLSLNPRPLVYRGFLSQVFTDLAEDARSKPEFEARMTEAEQALLAAPCDGLDRGAYQMGLLYMEWAADEPDPVMRLGLAQKASLAFDRALALEPNTEMVWRDSAAADILLLGREAEGREKIRRAGELVRNQNQLNFAEYYANRSKVARNVFLKRQYGNYALEYYDDVIKTASATGASTFNLIMARAGFALGLGDAQQAIASYSEAAGMVKEPQRWQAEKALADIYAKQGDTISSLRYHIQSIEHNPTNSPSSRANF